MLRGINVGPHNRVAMPALRDVVASLGHADVATYIQSGNVVFTAADPDAARLERAIAEQLGVDVRVALLSRDELARGAAENPYAGEPNPKLVHVTFLPDGVDPSLEQAVASANARAQEKGSADEAALAGGALFVHTPGGYGTSDLAKTLVRKVATGTARNWATVTKLLALLDA